MSFGAEEEDGNTDAVLDAGGGSPEKQIGKEAVSVSVLAFQRDKERAGSCAAGVGANAVDC